MGRKLTHLPTKPTTVDPEQGLPFIRKQHVNPNKNEPNNQPDVEIPASKKERHISSEAPILEETKPSNTISPSNGELNEIESSFTESLPSTVKYSDLERVFSASSDVFKVNAGSGNEAYYKPATGEDRNSRSVSMTSGTHYERQVLAYETTKFLGCEGLISPATYWKPEVTDKPEKSFIKEETIGSVQLSAHRFGEQFHKLENVRAAWVDGANFRKNLDQVENIQDLMVFDFVIGHLDRHGFNFMIGDKVDGWGKKVIGIDDGLSHPDTPVINDEWNNTTDLWRLVLRSEKGSKPIADSFEKGLIKFDANSYRELAKGHGQSDAAIDGVIERVNAIKEYSEKKFQDLKNWWNISDFNDRIEYEEFMKERAKLTPYDISQIMELKYNKPLI